MKLFGKDTPLYRLTESERGTLQGILLVREQAHATALSFIESIAKREEVPVGSRFDEKQQAFVRTPKPKPQPAEGPAEPTK